MFGYKNRLPVIQAGRTPDIRDFVFVLYGTVVCTRQVLQEVSGLDVHMKGLLQPVCCEAGIRLQMILWLKPVTPDTVHE